MFGRTQPFSPLASACGTDKQQQQRIEMNPPSCFCKWKLSNSFSSICAPTRQAANVTVVERTAPNNVNYSFLWTLLSANHVKGISFGSASFFACGEKPKDTGFFCHYTSNNTEKPLTVKLRLLAAMAALNTESVLSQLTLCFEWSTSGLIVLKGVLLGWHSLTVSTELDRFVEYTLSLYL